MKALLVLTAFASLSSFAATTVTVPAKDILVAARTIVSQSNPHYSVEGTISCGVISTGWSPTTSNCSITLEGKTAKVNNPGSIISAVQKVRPATGPVYKFEAKFKASATAGEFPPYKGSERATLILK